MFVLNLQVCNKLGVSCFMQSSVVGDFDGMIDVAHLLDSISSYHNLVHSIRCHTCKCTYNRRLMNQKKKSKRFHEQQVAQGQYVVSYIHCPPLSDCELEQGEAGQWPRRGQSPVKHRGTFFCLFIRSLVS